MRDLDSSGEFAALEIDATPLLDRGNSSPSSHRSWTNARTSDRWDAKRAEELAACSRAQSKGGPGSTSADRVMGVAMNILAGMLLWLMTLALAVGFATFAFLAMPITTHLGISMQILGTAVVFLFLGIWSRNPVSCVQASPIPAIYIGIFIRACEDKGLSDVSKVSTVLGFVWFVTIAQGIVFLICTRYHLGDMLQYFPVSVTTGYNGGIGLLILNASIAMMSGVNPLANMHSFLQPMPLLLALPGTVIAMVVYPLSLVCTGPAFKVGPILLTITAFYLCMYCSGTSLTDARDMGWIFPYYGFAEPTAVMSAFDYSAVDWSLMLDGFRLVPPMTFIALIAQYASLGAILMQVAGNTKDADEETKLLGWSSLVSGLMGSMPNLSGMAPSALLLGVLGDKGARGICLFVCGVLHLSLFLSGFPLVSYLPKCSIAGCLLMPIGIKMVRGALFESLAFSSWGDYLLIWVMSWGTLLLNIQWGLASGFLISVFRLLYEYALHDVVEHRESLNSVVTLKGRDAWSKHILDCHGNEVSSFRLKGVLFFGNCVSLKLELNELLEGPTRTEFAHDQHQPPPPKFVVVDFSGVLYVDSSVWEILASFTQRAKKRSATVVLPCGMSSALFKDVLREGEKLLSMLNIDHLQHSYLLTLEQIEDLILKAADVQYPYLDGWEQFTAWVASGMQPGGEPEPKHDELRERLGRYFKEQKYEQGSVVQREGARAEALIWVLSGEFHIFVRAPEVDSNLTVAQLLRSPSLPTRSPALKRAFGAATDKFQDTSQAMLYRKIPKGFIAGGEVFCHEVPKEDYRRTSFYQPMAAHTSIQCKHPGKVLRLSREDFTRLRTEDPQLCVALLVSVASWHEGQLRRQMRHRVEPEEVEIVDGCRRRFTMPTPERTFMQQVKSLRYAPSSSLLQLAQKAFQNLQLSAIKMRDKQAKDLLADKSGILVAHPH